MPGPTAGVFTPPFPKRTRPSPSDLCSSIASSRRLGLVFLRRPSVLLPQQPSAWPEHACVGRHGRDAKGRGIPAERWQLLCDGCAEPGHSADAGRLSICGGRGGVALIETAWVTGGPRVEDVRRRTREDGVSLKQ